MVNFNGLLDEDGAHIHHNDVSAEAPWCVFFLFSVCVPRGFFIKWGSRKQEGRSPLSTGCTIHLWWEARKETGRGDFLFCRGARVFVCVSASKREVLRFPTRIHRGVLKSPSQLPWGVPLRMGGYAYLYHPPPDLPVWSSTKCPPVSVCCPGFLKLLLQNAALRWGDRPEAITPSVAYALHPPFIPPALGSKRLSPAASGWRKCQSQSANMSAPRFILRFRRRHSRHEVLQLSIKRRSIRIQTTGMKIWWPNLSSNWVPQEKPKLIWAILLAFCLFTPPSCEALQRSPPPSLPPSLPLSSAAFWLAPPSRN